MHAYRNKYISRGRAKWKDRAERISIASSNENDAIAYDRRMKAMLIMIHRGREEAENNQSRRQKRNRRNRFMREERCAGEITRKRRECKRGNRRDGRARQPS